MILRIQRLVLFLSYAFRICLLLMLFSHIPVLAADSPVQANTGFVFSDEEEEEEKEIKSHFECYDMVKNVDKTICLDENLYLFHQLIESAYQQRVSLEPRNKSYSVRKDYREWLSNRERRCLSNVDCYLKMYKTKLVDLTNSPILVTLTLELHSETEPIIANVHGRKTNAGIFINKIVTLLASNPKTEKTIYIGELLNDSSWELFMYDPKINQLDVNFDGYNDFVLFLGAEGADSISTAYFIYNPENVSFTSDRLLNSLKVSSFDPTHKMVTVQWSKPDDDRFGIDYYQYSSHNRQKKNKLTLAFRHTFINAIRKDGSKELRRIIHKVRGRRRVKINTDTITRDQIGDLPEVMFQEAVLTQRQPITKKK